MELYISGPPECYNRMHLEGRKVVKDRPHELITRDGPFTYLHLAGKDTLVGQTRHVTLPGSLVDGGVQFMAEQESGYFLRYTKYSIPAVDGRDAVSIWA